MNLHAIVSSQISAVNPPVLCWLYRNSGYITGGDGKRIPRFAYPVQAPCQLQPLSNTDLQHLDGLNILGDRQGVYLNGNWDGVVRQDQKGGDLLVEADGTIWLTAYVFETWPDWCKLAVVRQLKRATVQDRNGAFILDISSLGGMNTV